MVYCVPLASGKCIIDNVARIPAGANQDPCQIVGCYDNLAVGVQYYYKLAAQHFGQASDLRLN
jgi:hypothetical protein